MFEFKLNQTLIDIKILGREIKLSVIKVILIVILSWVISAFVLCSCCTYTLTDVIDLAYDKVLQLLGDNNEVSLRIQNIHDKKCACDSPWYSPCVVWGNKQIKEDSCNKEGGCEENAYIKGANESESSLKKCGTSDCANKCKDVKKDKIDLTSDKIQNLTADNKFTESFYTRGGNRFTH